MRRAKFAAKEPSQTFQDTVARRQQYFSAITGLLLRRSRPLWPQNVACLDYSAGNGGPLVAYRWRSNFEARQICGSRIIPERSRCFRLNYLRGHRCLLFRNRACIAQPPRRYRWISNSSSRRLTVLQRSRTPVRARGFDPPESKSSLTATPRSDCAIPHFLVRFFRYPAGFNILFLNMLLPPWVND